MYDNEFSIDISRIWWERLSSSINVMEKLSSAFSCEENIIFAAPDGVPWRETFYDTVTNEACSFFANKKLHPILSDKAAEPGIQLLDMCLPETRNGYWPGMDVERYLADCDDGIFNQRFIWVSGITEAWELSRWTEFVSKYSACISGCEDGRSRATFILEYRGTIDSDVQKNMPVIEYRVQDFYRYAFCMTVVSEMNCSEALNQYIAELAYFIGGRDAERCGEMLTCGERLARDPQGSAGTILGTSLTDDELYSAVWNAQAKICFPILEGYRAAFVRKYLRKIRCYLPIKNMFGDHIDNPMDLDIGNLYYLTSRERMLVDERDEKDLDKCHRIRNLLAHSDPVSYGQMEYIVSLKV